MGCAGGDVPARKPKTPAQVDIEEAIERAKAAAPAKPKRTRAKKPTPATPAVDGPIVIVEQARDLPLAFCPFPGLHVADCDCGGEGGAR